MKLIHTADFHLGAGLESNLAPEKARIRRHELSLTFERMAEYAEQNEVSAILIAGDLFDIGTPSGELLDRVLRVVQAHAEIDFFYLRGNHDASFAPFDSEALPKNWHMFGAQWTSYDLGEVVLWGNDSGLTGQPLPALAPDRVHIVMLHGQLRAQTAISCAEDLPEKELFGHGISYLALGHWHSFQSGMLDAKTRFCYPGCPEGRGFDECGEKGFVLLETTESQTEPLSLTFVPFAKRQLYTITLPLDGCNTEGELLSRLNTELEKIPSPEQSLVKLELVGRYPPTFRPDIAYLTAMLESRFWFAKIKNSARMLPNESESLGDISLRGEFLRLVRESDESPDMQSFIAQMGLDALDGKDLQS